MRVMFAGGGTGGHLYPGLAIARALVRQAPEVQPFFVCALRGLERTVIVRRLVIKRVGAVIAADCLDDLTPPPPPKEQVAVIALRDRGAGRPTKRDRRDLDKFFGR